ncbi:MAG: DUF5693 family protein [Acidaminococcaceae bacterium]|nr:DUF5693 family protein [Acidaminococcaceae bacterium]MDO4935895.1 DUF5693 family protein [Phascolarctobacterium sp.]
MFKKFSFYKFTIFMILVGLLAASLVLTPRLGLEMNNRTVAQAINYEECYQLLKASGKYTTDVEAYFALENDLMRNVKNSGVNTIIVPDASLESLSRTGAVNLEIADGVVSAYETHSDIFDEVVAGAKRRYGNRVHVYGESPYRVLQFDKNMQPFSPNNTKIKYAPQELPLGIMSHELRKFYKLGFNLVVAPQNIPNLTKKDVDAYFIRLKNAGVPIYAMMPRHYTTFGGPDLYEYVAERMERQYFILQEHYTQLGFFPYVGQEELVKARFYDAIRAYTIDWREMKKITFEEAVRRWAIADDERHIRMNIITPFLQGSNDLLSYNLNYVKEITKRVEERGYKIGYARPLEVYFPNRVALIPIIAAIVGAFVLLCQMLLNWTFSTSIMMWGVITGISLFGNFVASTITHQMLAFMAAVSFPTLAILRITDMLDSLQDVPVFKILANGAISLALCVLFSLCGACLLGAILTDARFLLELDFYRGVKLTFVLPLIFVGILYLKKYDMLGFSECVTFGDYWNRVKYLFYECCNVKTILKIAVGLVILGAVAYVFIGRTGHSWQIPVPQFELTMRYWLEEHMYARPRAKEFLIGHIAFFFLVLAYHKSWPRVAGLILTVLAAIGQVSLVETFCHMRSPFAMSVARALGGYAFGAILGALLVWGFVKLREMKNGKEV